MSHNHKSLESGASWAQPQRRPKVLSELASGGCRTFAIPHGLAACSVNGFPSSDIGLPRPLLLAGELIREDDSVFDGGDKV